MAAEQFYQLPRVSDNAYVHTLTQVLFYATITLTLLTTKIISPVVFIAVWSLSLVSEAAILGCSIVRSDGSDGGQIACSATICSLLLVLTLCTCAGCLSSRSPHGLEEREPFLKRTRSQPSSSAASCQSRETVENVDEEEDIDSKGSDADDDSSDDEEELKEARERKIRDDGGWVPYLASFKVFLPYIVPSRNLKLQCYVAIVLANTIVQRALHVLHPYLLGSIIDILTFRQTIPWLRIILWVAVDSLANDNLGLEGLNDILLERSAAWSRQQVKTAAFDKILSLSTDFHDAKDSGEVIKAIEQAASINELFKVVVFEILPCIVDVLIAVWYVGFLLDVYAMLVVLAVGISFLFATIWASRSSAETRRVSSSKGRDESKVLFETISNWTVVSIFNRRSYETTRFSKVAKAAADADVQNNDMYIRMFASQEACERAGLIAVSIIAAFRISKGQSTVGDFVAMQSYWYTITIPLYMMSHSYRTIASNMIDTE